MLVPMVERRMSPGAAAAAERSAAARPPLGQVAAFFLKLGTIAFGGPAAHIAMMEDQLVRRRHWVSPEEFLDLLAVANLLPGPSSTELAIFIGYRLCGLAGLLAAGTCFILPAFVMVLAIAWAYVRYGSLPAATGLLYGVKPVVIAIVIQALWRLGTMAIQRARLAVLGALALAVCFLGVSPSLVLVSTAAAAGVLYLFRTRSTPVLLMPLVVPVPPAASAGAPLTLSSLFLVFLKAGSVVFGSGYVLLAFLRADLVTSRHWLTESQLLDSVAVGQVTPGPVFTTATFIGYVLAGPKGAAVATAGIFAPAFLLVAVMGPFVPRLRRSRLAGALLDGLNVASLALMAFVTWQLARSAIVDCATLALAAVSAALLFRFRINSMWLVAGGAALGLGLTLAGMR